MSRRSEAGGSLTAAPGFGASGSRCCYRAAAAAVASAFADRRAAASPSWEEIVNGT